MKYKGCYIEKTIFNTYTISDVFKKVLRENITSTKEAKRIVDEEILPNVQKNRYSPVHFSQYWWAVMDKTTNLYVRREDGKLLLFHRREQSVAWVDEHQEKI